MKRGLVLAAMLAAILFAMISVGRGEAKAENQLAVKAQPVIVPFINKNINDVVRKESVTDARLREGDLQGASVFERTVTETKYDLDRSGVSDRENSGTELWNGGEDLNDRFGEVSEYTDEARRSCEDDEGTADGNLETESVVPEVIGNYEEEGQEVESDEQVQPEEPCSTETYLGEWTVTAYCSCPICCGEYSSGYTASGTLATAYHTAACNVLPFGSQVEIDGIVYTIEDTGYSPYGDSWIDIYFDSHEEALAYGMRTREVYLVG